MAMSIGSAHTGCKNFCNLFKLQAFDLTRVVLFDIDGDFRVHAGPLIVLLEHC